MPKEARLSEHPVAVRDPGDHLRIRDERACAHQALTVTPTVRWDGPANRHTPRDPCHQTQRAECPLCAISGITWSCRARIRRISHVGTITPIAMRDRDSCHESVRGEAAAQVTVTADQPRLTALRWD